MQGVLDGREIKVHIFKIDGFNNVRAAVCDEELVLGLRERKSKAVNSRRITVD
jgi:hypothetical protein